MHHCCQLMHSRDGHVPDEQWEVMPVGSFLTTYYFQILSLLHVYFFLLRVFITSYCSSIVPAVLLSYCPACHCARNRDGLSGSDSSTQRGSSSWHVFHSQNIQVGGPLHHHQWQHWKHDSGLSLKFCCSLHPRKSQSESNVLQHALFFLM